MNRKVLGYPSTMGTGSANAWPFDVLFQGGTKQVTPDDVYNGDVDAIVIWGGEDISPSLYKEKPFHTYATETLSRRDRIESDLVTAAMGEGIPIIGVCRGAQLVCAMSGGKLVQHVTGHGGRHGMRTVDGRSISTTSVHHQMMWPFEMPKDDYHLIAWSEENRSDIYHFREGDTRDKVAVEPEVVYFPKTKALGIQGHPEFCSSSTDSFVKYSLELVGNLLKGQL